MTDGDLIAVIPVILMTIILGVAWLMTKGDGDGE